jgi:hypothetical protein
LGIDDAIEQLVHKQVLPPPELRAQLLQILEMRRVECLMRGEYDGAEQQDRIFVLLQNAVQSAEQKLSEDRAVDSLYRRWQQLQQAQQQAAARWDAKVAEFVADHGRQVAELQMQHEAEVERFAGRWKDAVFLRPFTKPSSRLLQLREQERAMGIARMYARAKETKAAADKLQKEETRAAQARIGQQMAVERAKLAAKHEREAAALEAYRERTIRAIQGEREKEMRPGLTAIRQIKAKRAAPRRQQLPTVTEENTPAQAETGGVAKRYARFRAEKKPTLLDVAPADDQVLAQMKRPPSARTRSVLTARRRNGN